MNENPEGARPATDAWKIGRTDMRSYTGDGEPVHFLYPPDDGARIPFYGDDCVERATQVCDLLNQQAARIETLESTIASRHGGEPLALLDLLDEARERIAELEKLLTYPGKIARELMDENAKLLGRLEAARERAEKAERERDERREVVARQTPWGQRVMQQRDALAAALRELQRRVLLLRKRNTMAMTDRDDELCLYAIRAAQDATEILAANAPVEQQQPRGSS